MITWDNLYDFIARVRLAGDVKRWHTKRTLRSQSLSSHQYGVAMLIQLIDPDCSKALIMSALTHDLPEIDTGDIPAPAKWGNPDLESALIRIEETSTLCFDFDINDEEVDLLKWADSAELMLWCQEEVNMGNTYCVQTVTLILERIRQMPITKHHEAIRDFLNDFTERNGYV